MALAAAAAAATVVADLTGNNNCLLSLFELPQISLPVLVVVVANKASSKQAGITQANTVACCCIDNKVPQTHRQPFLTDCWREVIAASYHHLSLITGVQLLVKSVGRSVGWLVIGGDSVSQWAELSWRIKWPKFENRWIWRHQCTTTLSLMSSSTFLGRRGGKCPVGSTLKLEKLFLKKITSRRRRRLVWQLTGHC